MVFEAILAPGLVLCGMMLYGFDAVLATGEYCLIQSSVRLCLRTSP